jgi:hypothetical protein
MSFSLRGTRRQKRRIAGSMRKGKRLPWMGGHSMDFPKRGEIWLVSLEPTIGHEIGKTRPGLVISNNRKQSIC